MQTVDPAKAVHPLRLEQCEDTIRDIFARIDTDDEDLTLDEIEAALDWLYDYTVGQLQTVPGTTVLQ